MKTMSHPNAKAMMISQEEYNALKAAQEVLNDVQYAFGGENTLMSLETGEVITPGELARAMSILEFIATHRMIEVNP